MGPIRGQIRPAPVEAVVMAVAQLGAKLNASIHNRFDIEVVDAKTGEVRQRARAENIVLNCFWNTWMSSNYEYYNFSAVSVGSGSGTLDATRTSLFSKLGVHKLTNKIYTRDDANCVYSIRGSATIDESTYVGSNLTEIGLTCNTQSLIVTHAMLTDANGNPVSIAKTSTDIINIYSTIFVHWTASALSGLTLSDELLKAIAGGGGLYRDNHCSYAKVVNGSTISIGKPTITVDTTRRAYTAVFPRISASTCNGHGINKLAYSYLNNNNGVGYEFVTANYPFTWRENDVVTGEAIGTGDGTTTAFSTYFPYAENATVYVDGVAASNVTVTKSSSFTADIVFATAPASGAVITADYTTGVIAKDANHVFDFTLVIACGTYSS